MEVKRMEINKEVWKESRMRNFNLYQMAVFKRDSKCKGNIPRN